MKRLGGLSRMRPQNYRRIHKHYRRVNRAYGGVFDHSEVKNRIIRTFLTEEVKRKENYGPTSFSRSQEK